MEDSFKLKGTVVIQRRKKDGTVIDEEHIDNLVVNVGKERVAKLINEVSSTGFTAIAVGTDNTAPQASDTALVAEDQRATATTAYEASYKATLEKTFSFGSSKTIKEAGVFDSAVASGSTMFDRFTFSDKNVDTDVDLYVKITITVS